MALSRSQGLCLALVRLLVIVLRDRMNSPTNITARDEARDSGDWLKLDLHIHTHEDPRDRLDYSARELLARARRLGFHVLAITLHDSVFNPPEVMAAAKRLGLLLIPAAEMRIEGADVILLNVTQSDVEGLNTFADLRELRVRRGTSIFTIAPHPFYLLGASIGRRLVAEIDCFDGIEYCHFHKGIFNPNARAVRLAEQFGKPLIATSDAHRLSAFGHIYTMVPRAAELTAEGVFAQLRAGRLRLHSPPATVSEIASTFYFVFLKHPLRSSGFGRRR
jgi:predicted metal-dependent phosphoesterase TrpH